VKTGRRLSSATFTVHRRKSGAQSAKEETIITRFIRRTAMECAAPHKAAGVREAIEARGAMLRYLLKYSPDLNPIEMPFSKLKAYLRKAAERTIPRLRRRIGRFARTFTTREASNYFRHAGYA
jgi:transposase